MGAKGVEEGGLGSDFAGPQGVEPIVHFGEDPAHDPDHAVGALARVDPRERCAARGRAT